MRIAICDDDSLCREEVARLVREYMQQSVRLIDLSVYENGTGLLEDARHTGIFDIYILDILMPLLDGIELGLELRKMDPDSKIIYLTSSPDFAFRAIKAKVWEYLLKPVQREDLFSSLDEAFAVLTEKRENLGPVNMSSLLLLPGALPALGFFFLLSRHRDIRLLFSFCFTSTIKLVVTDLTAIADFFLGNTYLVMSILRFLICPIVVVFFWKWQNATAFGL